MKNIFKIFPEEKYKNIINEIGSRHYHIYEKDEITPDGVIAKALPFQNYNCVVGGTGCSAEAYAINGNYQNNVIIPKGGEVIVIRLLRYDDSHREPHYNANDQLIFPVQDGRILRLLRKDAPDHYVKITSNADIISIADAYKLPEDKSGHISKYNEKGASLHVDFSPHANT